MILLYVIPRDKQLALFSLIASFSLPRIVLLNNSALLHAGFITDHTGIKLYLFLIIFIDRSVFFHEIPSCREYHSPKAR